MSTTQGSSSSGSGSVRTPVFTSSTGTTSQDFFDSPEVQEYWRNSDVTVTSVKTQASTSTSTSASAASSSKGNGGSGSGSGSGNGREEEEGGDDKKSDEITEKKKERNRILARETRQRKKFFFESLQKEVKDLVQENNHLKSLAQSLDPAVGKKIISECCSELPDIVKAVSSNNEQTSMLGQADFSLISAICSAQRSFCISDPALPDNPLVFASQGFLDLTGYTMDEVLGRNCRFLQGPQTDLAGIAVLGQGIAEGVDTSVMLLNYKKDGTTFWNQIYCSALRDSDDNIVNYVGVQIEVLPSELENAQASDKQSQKKPKLS